MADFLFIAINTVGSLFNLSFIFVIVCGFFVWRIFSVCLCIHCRWRSSYPIL